MSISGLCRTLGFASWPFGSFAAVTPFAGANVAPFANAGSPQTLCNRPAPNEMETACSVALSATRLGPGSRFRPPLPIRSPPGPSS